ncbi:MAG TPA: Na+/H+ antiporter subunit E [Gammaproteobacteria bacterium]
MIRPRRWLPHPLLTLTLTGVWLLLVNTLSAGHILLGLLLGVAIPLLTRDFWPSALRVRRPRQLIAFGFRVLGDILIANLHVARLILRSPAQLRPAFVRVPLDLDDDFAITLLASTISLTPGTVSADVSADRRTLLVHALDVDDPAALVAQIKQRYEAPLKESFACSP